MKFTVVALGEISYRDQMFVFTSLIAWWKKGVRKIHFLGKVYLGPVAEYTHRTL